MSRLFMYELKKLINRRLVWVSLIVSLLLCLFTICAPLVGSYYVNGERISSNYEQFRIDTAYQKALDGRVIDEALIKEMQTAYSQVPLDVEPYSLTEEYQKYARPYSAILGYVRMVTGMSVREAIQWVVSMEELHTKRLEKQELRWDNYQLTEDEKAFWRTQEEKLEMPMTYRYIQAYSVLISAVYTVGLLAVFMTAVCLAGAFPQEHVRRTDQLILSSKLGRRQVYRAKLAAGIFLAQTMTLVFILFTIGAAFIVYGVDGFNGVFQLEYSASSCPISIGEAVIIAYMMVLFAGVFMGLFVMMLSEVLHSSVGTLAIAVGIIILPMFFMMPEEYRVLAQLWSYLPGDFVSVWSIFSPYTVRIGNWFLQPWQAVPILYTILGVVFAVVTKRVYVKYQVSGR